MKTIEVKIADIHAINEAWITRDLKAHLERIIGEALKVETNEDGEWEITDSSVKMAVDDILTHYDLKERAE